MNTPRGTHEEGGTAMTMSEECGTARAPWTSRAWRAWERRRPRGPRDISEAIEDLKAPTP